MVIARFCLAVFGSIFLPATATCAERDSFRIEYSADEGTGFHSRISEFDCPVGVCNTKHTDYLEFARADFSGDGLDDILVRVDVYQVNMRVQYPVQSIVVITRDGHGTVHHVEGVGQASGWIAPLGASGPK